MTVAVLGTGIMGAAMARSLVRDGQAVRCWNRTRARAEPLAADGIEVSDTPAEAVRDADVVVTMLFDGAAVLAVMAEAGPAARAGACWVQSTTVGLDTVAELGVLAAEHELVLFDAPVLGTREPAEAGQLIVLASGPEDHRETVAPVFDAVGARTVWAGEAGAGTRLKLVANTWLLAATHGAVEALALAEALGVNPDDFLGVIRGGPLDMPYLHLKTGLVRSDRLSPTSFALVTAAKDARLIVDAAEAHGVRLDQTVAGLERFRRAAEKGHGDEDMAASYFA
ncbi:NAD(P)-dependent oxidoreductase [Paractinoplanes ferrugineus]|uniref:Dehydrogenase n=1 Tax=Paractinoplanes ferrugineus TaxID=113564 RepID=A0A919J4K5_9ACTN|nr:NAD(P)-dependent oxidoreductase [Actinoplanes ferrugineus]GIE12883.1 dehydrogenase [Actinoplanes ferrugineus]